MNGHEMALPDGHRRDADKALTKSATPRKGRRRAPTIEANKTTSLADELSTSDDSDFSEDQRGPDNYGFDTFATDEPVMQYHSDTSDEPGYSDADYSEVSDTDYISPEPRKLLRTTPFDAESTPRPPMLLSTSPVEQDSHRRRLARRISAHSEQNDMFATRYETKTQLLLARAKVAYLGSNWSGMKDHLTRAELAAKQIGFPLTLWVRFHYGLFHYGQGEFEAAWKEFNALGELKAYYEEGKLADRWMDRAREALEDQFQRRNAERDEDEPENDWFR